MTRDDVMDEPTVVGRCERCGNEVDTSDEYNFNEDLCVWLCSWCNHMAEKCLSEPESKPPNGVQGEPATPGFPRVSRGSSSTVLSPGHETKAEVLSSSTGMTPIPTVFNGIKYRSRLEARWAVFFECLGLNYMYEYEGFRLEVQPWSENRASELWYVPDFYLPKMDGKRDYWFEVKPYGKWQDDWNKVISTVDMEKIIRFGHVASKAGADFGVLGNISLCKILKRTDDIWDDAAPEFAGVFENRGSDSPYWFCRCEKCNAIGFEFEGRMERAGCCGHTSAKHKHRTYADRVLVDAYDYACRLKFGTR